MLVLERAVQAIVPLDYMRFGRGFQAQELSLRIAPFLRKHDVLFAGETVLDALHDNVQVPRLVDKVKVVRTQREHWAQIEIADPFFIKGVQQGEILLSDGDFHPAAAAVDAVEEDAHRRSQVKKQVGARKPCQYQIKDAAV